MLIASSVYLYLRRSSGFARKNSLCRELVNTFWLSVHLATPHFLYSWRYRRRSRRSKAQKANWRRCAARQVDLREPHSQPSTWDINFLVIVLHSISWSKVNSLYTIHFAILLQDNSQFIHSSYVPLEFLSFFY